MTVLYLTKYGQHLNAPRVGFTKPCYAGYYHFLMHFGIFYSVVLIIVANLNLLGVLRNFLFTLT